MRKANLSARALGTREQQKRKRNREREMEIREEYSVGAFLRMEEGN